MKKNLATETAVHSMPTAACNTSPGCKLEEYKPAAGSVTCVGVRVSGNNAQQRQQCNARMRHVRDKPVGWGGGNQERRCGTCGKKSVVVWCGEVRAARAAA